MMSISAMGRGQHAYYTELAYYSKEANGHDRTHGGEPPGQWWGGAVEHFGLGKFVEPDQLRRLFDGQHPTKRGVPDLVRNAGTAERRPGWDLTFSAPKTVSLLWANSSPSVQRQVEDIHRRACETALTHLESKAGFIRTGKAGAVLHAAKWAVAMFEHGTSRALDPQLHTHCLLMNVGVREDGKTAPIASKQIYYGKMVAGAVYRAELANLLTRELGVVCEPERVGFRVAGIPEELVTASSKRRAAIEAELGGSGMETASAAAFAAAAKSTRTAKDHVPPREELFKRWREEGQAHGFKPEDVLHKASLSTPNLQRKLLDVVDYLTADRAHFTRDMLFRTAADRLVKTPVDSMTLLSEVDRFLAKSKKVVEIQLGDGHERFTTQAILDEERKLIGEASRLARTKGVGAAAHDIEKVIASYSRPRSVLWAAIRHHATQLGRELLKQETVPFDLDAIRQQSQFTLNDEQKQALRELTRDNRDSLRVLEAGAGTGKTTLLGIARQILEQEGLRVIGVAVSGKAARGLQEGAGIPSQTYQMLQTVMHPSSWEQIKHGTKQYFRALVAKPTFNLDIFKFDKNTVLVVDEASMLNNEQLTTLLEDCRKANATIVLVGDRTQLQAIGRGGGLAYLGDRFGAATLEENLRQQDPEDRKTLRSLLDGDGAAVLKSLSERGRLHVAKDQDAAMQKLVTDWTSREEGRRDRCFIFASTNDQVDTLNKACQEARIKNGEIDEKKHAQAENDRLLRGDRVMVTWPARKLGLDNGDCGVITKIAGSGKRAVVVVDLDRGETVEIPLSSFNHLRLGYAMTTHKAQGQTTQSSYVLAGGGMQDRELTNVQLSRARGETHLYLSKQEADRLAQRIEQSRQQELLAAEQRRRQQEADELRRRKR